MCDQKEGISLCTCHLNSEKIYKDKPYWILTRKAPRQKDRFGQHIVGDCFIDKKLRTQILNSRVNPSVNDRDFDRVLNVRPKDKLDIVTPTQTYRYELRKNGWQFTNTLLINTKQKLETKV